MWGCEVTYLGKVEKKGEKAKCTKVKWKRVKLVNGIVCKDEGKIENWIWCCNS
jgi:hypothetical protein